LTTAAIIAAAAFVISYFAQGKAWRYHSLPATGCMFIALTTLLFIRETGNWGRLRNIVIAAVMLLPVGTSLIIGTYRNREESTVIRLMGGSENAVVLMLTINPSKIWPAVENAGRRWPSRHFAFWMVAAAAVEMNAKRALSPPLANLIEQTIRDTVDDLNCNPADIIIVDERYSQKYPNFDILGLFINNPEFKDIFDQYRKSASTRVFTVYKRKTRSNIVAKNTCRRIY
jgi:hypothetical protein